METLDAPEMHGRYDLVSEKCPDLKMECRLCGRLHVTRGEIVQLREKRVMFARITIISPLNVSPKHR